MSSRERVKNNADTPIPERHGDAQGRDEARQTKQPMEKQTFVCMLHGNVKRMVLIYFNAFTEIFRLDAVFQRDT